MRRFFTNPTWSKIFRVTNPQAAASALALAGLDYTQWAMELASAYVPAGREKFSFLL